MTGSGNPIPERMRRRGRPANQDFQPTEAVFLRFDDQILERSEEDPDSFYLNIRMPDTSVNRSKPDGHARDVLLVDWPRFRDWGILSFEVRQIPTPDESPKREAIHYRIQHDPLELNFYHCEIRAFRDATCRARMKNFKSKWKTWFRMELSQRLSAANILKEPSPH